MVGDVEMVWIHRVWWRVLIGFRPMGRYLCDRFKPLAVWVVFWRWFLHLVAGCPIVTAVALIGLVVVDVPLLHWAGFTLLVAVWMGAGLAWAFDNGGPRWVMRLVGRRLATRLRRRLPREWAEGAVKTVRVQAEVGTSSEPRSSTKLRPVLDHPPIGWFPTIEWPVVSWWIGPPPGRTMAAWEELAPVLASQLPHVENITVVYRNPSSSWARLVVLFANTMTETYELPLEAADPTGPPPFADLALVDTKPEPDDGSGEDAVVVEFPTLLPAPAPGSVSEGTTR